MPSSPFPLLPPHGLDQSITLAVLVGVLCLHALTETFGWVFVGLVVPGYLASVICIAPEAAAAVCVEAVLTYGLAGLLSNLMSSTGVWSKFFGRDRFFLIVLCSVLVRQNCELWILPEALRWVDRSFGTHLALDSQYSSIGLVLVPLTANVLWKVGLTKSLKQLGIPTLFTYLVLTCILLPYTNLSYSSLALTFEDVALDFLGSPKAYIILLVSGYIASRFNLLYGWDYNGILVPSLLALTWFEPMRLVATIADCLLQLVFAKAVLALPGIRTMNLEGPRKTTVIFSLAFLLKYAAGWGLMVPWPQVNVTDLFGFGYILPTLLTVKILQKKTLGRVLLPAVLSSFLGFSIASILGFTLDLWLPQAPAKTAFAVPEPTPVATRILLRDAYGAAAFAVARTRRDSTGIAPLERAYAQRVRYASLWSELDAWLALDKPGVPQDLLRQAGTLGLTIRELGSLGERRTYALVEVAEPLRARIGWDVAVLRPGAQGPVVEVPRPWSEGGAADASVDLCNTVDCRVILWSGVDTERAQVSFGDATRSEQTAFAVAHEALSSRTILQLRAARPGDQAELSVRTEIPDSLREILEWSGVSSVAWRAPLNAPVQWPPLRRFSVLSVPTERLMDLATLHSPPITEARSLEVVLREDPAQASAPTPGYKLSESELDHLTERVVPAWVQAAATSDPRVLATARLYATQLGLSVFHVEREKAYVLIEKEASRGTFALVVREGDAAPVTVAAPRPAHELGTAETSLFLWRQARGRLLIIGGLAVPDSRGEPEGDALPTAMRAAHLAMQRHTVRDTRASVLIVRGLAAWRALPDDVVVGLRQPLLFQEHEPAPLRTQLAVRGAIASLSANVRVVGGTADLLGLGAEHDPLAQVADALNAPEVAVVWIAQRVRDRFQRRSREQFAANFRLLGATPVDVEAAEALSAGLSAASEPISQTLTAEITAFAERLARYTTTNHVHTLRALRDRVRATGGTVTPYYDPTTGLPFLLAEWRVGRATVRALGFTLPGSGHTRIDVGTEVAGSQIDAAIRQRTPLLVAYGTTQAALAP